MATAAHPGYAATNLQFHSQRRSLDPIRRIGNRFLAQDEDGGALPTLYAAVADVPGNSFAGPGGFMEQRGAPKLVNRSDAAKDAVRGAPAVGRLRGADRRAVPAAHGRRPPRRRQPTRSRSAVRSPAADHARAEPSTLIHTCWPALEVELARDPRQQRRAPPPRSTAAGRASASWPWYWTSTTPAATPSSVA